MTTLIVVLVSFFGVVGSMATCAAAILSFLNKQHLGKQDSAIQSIEVKVDGRLDKLTTDLAGAMSYIRQLEDSRERVTVASIPALKDNTSALRDTIAVIHAESVGVGNPLKATGGETEATPPTP